MFKFLAGFILVVTPTAVLLAWLTVGPLAALAAALAVPVVSIGFALVRALVSPERTAAELAERRDVLRSRLDS